MNLHHSRGRSPGLAALWLSCILNGPASADEKKGHVERVCELIGTHAAANALPPEFFARLIWKESRFDPNALSPVGAEGIAQFMPGTAKLRGLSDPFNIDQAIPASAAYLAELKEDFGNLGLAAAAYNAGEKRVSRWLASGGSLPLETENYVLDILGEPAVKFSDAAYTGTVHPLDPKRDFNEACRKMPVIRTAGIPTAWSNSKPWGVQVAGNFRRDAAVGQFKRVQKQFSKLLSGYSPVVSRIRPAGGRGNIYAVLVGTDSKKTADALCAKLRSAGGACLVKRNR